MSEENKNNDCTPETFIAFNEAIGMVKVTDAQYNESTREMCELTIFSVLSKIFYYKDVYEKVLTYMIENKMYERYAKAIFELQFCPPPPPQTEGQGGGDGNGEGQEGDENAQDDNQPKGEKPKDNPSSGGGVAQENKKTNQITKDFIHRMFSDDENI